MELAVIGASGIVGSQLVREVRARGKEVKGTFLHERGQRTDLVRLDIGDERGVVDFISDADPKRVVLTAAVSDVDECELNPNRAWEVNVEGTLNVASACGEMGCPLILISSDYVFNGLKGAPYREGDPPDPINIYGRTKLEAERLVLDSSPSNLILRVSLVFGWARESGRDNLATRVIRELRGGRSISLFHDQWNCPTYAPVCASLLLDLIDKDRSTVSLFEGEDRGIIHLAGRDCVSRYEMGLMVAEVFGLEKDLVRPVSLEEAGLPAPRPRRPCLSVAKLEAELNTRITSLTEALEDMRSKEGMQ